MTSGRYGLTLEDWHQALSDQPSYRIDQLWEGLWADRRPLEEISNLPLALRKKLAAEHPLALEVAMERVADDGATVKWLYRLDDGYQIETVLMQYDDRATVCVSSQAGCAMGCTFCATGQAGFDRHLRSDEIIEQVVRAQHHDPSKRVSHIVFMGMGEPLANIEPVWSAVERIHEQLGISARRITISTVGVVPGIEFLSAAPLPVGLALSLHAATDEKRRPLVPLNRNYDIDELMEACERYLDRTHRRVTFEWALIDGVNDTDEDAAELSVLARSIGAHVNVIPLNPTSGYATRGTPEAGVGRFCASLRSFGVNVTVRQTRGRDIDAACGQLRNDNPTAVEVVRKPADSTPD